MRVVTSFDPSVVSTIPSGPYAGQQGGTFDLKQTGSVRFKVKNDSNISIHLYYPNGTDAVVVAGEEQLFCMDIPTSLVTWIQDVALNVNGSPLVSKVYVSVLDQTDRIQGTYPFHITRLTNFGSTVPLSASVATLSNETNSSQTLVIDIGESGHTLLVTINNDGSFVWNVLQSGTAHQILKGQTSGSPLQIGQSADNIEFLGNPLIPNNTAIRVKDSGGTIRDMLLNDNTDQIVLKGNSGPGGGAGAVVLANATNAVWKIQSGSSGPALLVGTITLLGGSISRQNGGELACGNGTVISHGLGATPTYFGMVPNITQPGSATVGFAGENTSTFTATVGSGSRIGWIAGVT